MIEALYDAAPEIKLMKLATFSASNSSRPNTTVVK